MLFPANLPNDEWTQFKAEGFRKPVTGAIYRGGRARPGMPLGGIGTGFISLGTDGTLDYMSTIFNDFLGRRKGAQSVEAWGIGLDEEGGGGQFMKREHIPTHPLPFLGFSVGGKTCVLTLQRMQGVDTAREIHYWGHYPIADVEYETDAPISLGLRAWATFLPGDAVASNTPGAVFEVHLRNMSRAVQTGTVAFSFHGPREAEVGGPTEFTHRPTDGDLSGVEVSTGNDGMEYAYTLAALGEQSVRVGGELGDNSAAWKRIGDVLPETDSSSGGACVAVDFSLDPGEVRVIRIILSWYAPYWQGEVDIERSSRLALREISRLVDWTVLPRNNYVHMYRERFDSALEAAKYLADDHESLLKRILAWQEVIYAEQRLPGWLRDSIVNIFHVISQVTFWDKSADPNHWCKEGFFVANETLLTCPQQACIACDAIADWPINLFFPELIRSKLRIFKHYQKDYGLIPSTLGPGTELDMRWYDQQTAVDGQAYVHLVDRVWQVTTDDSVIEEFYSSVKRCIIFMKSLDVDDDGLIELFEKDSTNYPEAKGQYHDDWLMTGVACHISTLWLSTLRIVERMAMKAGDRAFAEKCRRDIEHGSKALEDKLWNRNIGCYYLYHNVETGDKSDTVLADQLVGEAMAHLHGLPHVVPSDRVKTTLDTLWRLNVAATSFGIRDSVRPDGTTDESGGYTGIANMGAYCTQVPAVLLVANGDPERGLEMPRRLWHQYVFGLGMAWDMPNGITAEGEWYSGHEYWHNTMLWVLPLAVLGEDLAATSAPGGFAHGIMQAARGNDAAGKP